MKLPVLGPAEECGPGRGFQHWDPGHARSLQIEKIQSNAVLQRCLHPDTINRIQIHLKARSVFSSAFNKTPPLYQIAHMLFLNSFSISFTFLSICYTVFITTTMYVLMY